MSIRLVANALLVATAMVLFATSFASAQYYRLSASPETKLRTILKSHVYQGLPITRAMRAATGDPNITIIDRRRIGRSSICGYEYRYNRRIMTCS